MARVNMYWLNVIAEFIEIVDDMGNYIAKAIEMVAKLI